jgi:acetyl esterase/lipase
MATSRIRRRGTATAVLAPGLPTLLVVLGLVLPLRAEDPRPEEVSAEVAGPLGSRLRRDIEHTRIGKRSVRLDLYRPREEVPAPYPTVVWVHGGGWIGGSKEPCPLVSMTTSGYAVASVEYRLSTEAAFPAQIEDCKAAVRWVRANAKEHGLDPDRIGAAGASAGGHLVALLGTAGDVKALEGRGRNRDASSRVRAVCDFFGPTDLLQFDGHGSTIVASAPGSVVERLLGGPLEERRALAVKANPITHVTKDDPPFLILHGDRDAVVPLHQSELLHAALRKAEVPSELRVQPGAGHGWNDPETNRAVLRFFDRHLKGAPPQAPRDDAGR